MSPEEQKPEPSPAPQSQPVAPQKPEGPPNIKVREGKQPEKPEGPRNIETFEQQSPKGRPKWGALERPPAAGSGGSSEGSSGRPA